MSTAKLMTAAKEHDEQPENSFHVRKLNHIVQTRDQELS